MLSHGKLDCSYMRCLLDALMWSKKQGHECLESLLEQLDYLDRLPQWESVVKVALGPMPYRCTEGDPPPSMSWAGYSSDDGRPWQDRQVIAGGLNCNRQGVWSVNT